MTRTDLRGFLADLEADGELARVHEVLSARYEIAAVLYELGRRGGPAVVMENVDGRGRRLAGNLLGTKRRFARALGVTSTDVEGWVAQKRSEKIRPRLIDDGPIHEHSYDEAVDLRRDVPALVHAAKDRCPYLTAGVVFSRHPVSAEVNMAIHRVGIVGARETTLAVNQDPTRTNYRLAQELGLDLEVAVAVGVPPTVLVASCTPGIAGSKLDFAGALGGEAVEMVPCHTVDVQVPAAAEWVIEGRIHHDRQVLDGPLVEVTGYYMSFPGMLMSVSALTSRTEPIYQGLHPASPECSNLVRFTTAAEVASQLREVIPAVLGVSVHPGIFDDLVAIRMRKESNAQARELLHVALTCLPRWFKIAVIVDEDVDIDSTEDVMWAVLTRVRPPSVSTSSGAAVAPDSLC